MKITGAEPSEKDHNPASVRACVHMHERVGGAELNMQEKKTTATMYFLHKHPPTPTAPCVDVSDGEQQPGGFWRRQTLQTR